jgi:hypothetical protein
MPRDYIKMPSKPLIMRPIKLTTTIPEDVYGRMALHLYSEIEGRIPKGAIQRFLVDRINEFFNRRPQ